MRSFLCTLILTVVGFFGPGTAFADNQPISPGLFVQGIGEYHSFQDDPAADKARGLFWSTVIYSLVGIAVVAGITGAVIRIMLYAGEKAVCAYFKTHFKHYSHAYCVGDETGIAQGRYSLKYPKLMVGEVEFDVRGSSLKAGHLLKLRDGVVIEFYDGDGILKDQAKQEAQMRHEEKVRLAAAHPEDATLQPSIFDKDEEEEELAS